MNTRYARVSTDDQTLETQKDALQGAKHIYADKITVTKKARPELNLMIDQLRENLPDIVAPIGVAVRDVEHRPLAESALLFKDSLKRCEKHE